jgi:uncharacterized protein (TIGR02145 family)
LHIFLWKQKPLENNMNVSEVANGQYAAQQSRAGNRTSNFDGVLQKTTRFFMLACLCLLGSSCGDLNVGDLNVGDCLRGTINGTSVDFCPSDDSSSSYSLSSSSSNGSSSSSSLSSSSSSPSSGTVLCILGSSCVTLSIADCVEHGTPVDFCPSNGGSSSSSQSSSSSDGGSSSSSQSSSSSDGSSSSSSLSSSSSVCTDNSYGAGTSLTYEGKTYNTVKIGCQTWMAKNLNFNAESSRCYNNQESNCNTYGRLYDWVTAMALPASCNETACADRIGAKHRGVCPAGWHIPSDAEWATLVTFAGGESAAGKKLKATSGWDNNSNGDGSYTFAALPGGRGYSYGSFTTAGYNGSWWSASEYDSNYAYGRYMGNSREGVSRYYSDKSILFSVRCLQDY